MCICVSIRVADCSLFDDVKEFLDVDNVLVVLVWKSRAPFNRNADLIGIETGLHAVAEETHTRYTPRGRSSL